MTMLKLVGLFRHGSSIAPKSTSSWCMSKHQVLSVACSSTSTANKPAPSETKPVKAKSKFPMIEKVFHDLSNISKETEKLYNSLEKAKTVDELLSVADKTYSNRTLMLLIISTLNQWVKEKKIAKADFDSDPRYQELCTKMKVTKKVNNDSIETRTMRDTKSPLPKTPSTPSVRAANVQNLIQDHDNYNSQVALLSVKEAVDVWNGLTLKGSREKPLLDSLALHLIKNPGKLNIKEKSDILYGMAKLNFLNDTLLAQVCQEIVESVKQVTQSPVIGSIITSLGLLKYRNDAVMNALAEWAVENKKKIRTQDVCSFLMTLATIGYKPVNSDAFFNELVFTLKETDMIRSTEWLDIVWALTTLNQVSSEHITSVLNEKFISKLCERDNVVPLVKKLKLLNINATAKYLIKHYSGPQLPKDSPIFDAPIINCRDKEIFVRSIKDTLATLFPSRDHFRENINDGTGFLIDLDFYMDKNLTPIPVDQASGRKDLSRVVIVANSYQSFCRGEAMLLGPVRLHYRFLQARQCRILDISYLDFHTADILLNRISYINNRIKAIFK